MKIDKKTLMPIIVLVSICVIVAALLGAVNMLTAPKIAEDALKAEQAALFDVLPEEKDGFELINNIEGLPKTVKAVYKSESGVGFVVSLATTSQYSSGDLAFVMGVDNDGKIAGIKINSYLESKDFGKETYPASFAGKTLSDYNSVGAVSGVTYSSDAFKSAIGDGFVAIALANGEKVEKPESAPETSVPEQKPEAELPKTDSEILALFEEMAASKLTLKDINSGADDTVKRLYTDEGGKGYFAYIVTSTQWVPVETEGAIYIDNNGDIKDIRLLTWTVGHGVDYTKAFVESFKNKDNWHSESIALVSEATGTSVNFKNAVFAAVKAVTDVMPRTEEKILSLAGELVQNEKGFEKISLPDGADSVVKAIYKETSGKGYVAYLVTSTQWVARETETLVYVDRFGKISDIKVLTWTVGHGIDYTEDFTGAFIGMSKADFDGGVDITVEENKKYKYGIELVSGATGTAEHLADAVKEAFEVMPEPSVPVWRIVGIASALLLITAFIGIMIFTRKRRAPYEK